MELKFLRLEFHHFISHHLFFFFFLFSTQHLFFSSQILHPASVLLQPDHLPLFFFRAPDRFPLPFFFFRSVDRLFPLFFFISGSGFMELESKKLEFHVDKLFHLNSPNSSLWGWILSPSSSFTDSRC